MSGGVFQGPAYGDPGPEETPGVNPLLCYLCHQVVYKMMLNCELVVILVKLDLPRALSACLLPHLLCLVSQVFLSKTYCTGWKRPSDF